MSITLTAMTGVVASESGFSSVFAPDDRCMAPSPQHTSALSVQATELIHRATVGPALARQKRNTCSDGPVISIANTILIVCPRRLREARESGRSLTTKLVKALPADVRTAAIEAVRDVVDEAVEKQLLPPPGCPGPLAVTTIESVADEVAQGVSHTFAGALVEGLIGWGWLGRRGPSAWNPWCWIPRERLWEKMWGRFRGHVESPSDRVAGSLRVPWMRDR